MPPGADRPLAMPLVRCKMYIYVKRIAIIAMTLSLACKTCKHAFCFRILRIDAILQKTMYAMNLYNFQENLFLFSRNFTIWIGVQLASQTDSFQVLGSCFCEKYINPLTTIRTGSTDYSEISWKLMSMWLHDRTVLIRSTAITVFSERNGSYMTQWSHSL